MPRDQRGSILLPGMAMGLILTLLGLHIIGTSKAILARSLGQNAVDAIALEGAVWHAQGMNLIVLINVAMAAIFSILVAIRVVEILLVGSIAILTIAAAVASFFSLGSAGTAATSMIRQLTKALVGVERFENRVSDPILHTLSMASDAERTVAAVMPYIALAHPVTQSNDVPGIPLSFSLVPAEFERRLSKFPNVAPFKDEDDEDSGVKIGGFEVESSFPPRMGALALPGGVDQMVSSAVAKLPGGGRAAVNAGLALGKHAVGSLPVQEEDFYQVCGRAAELMTATVLQVLARPAGLGQGAIDKVSSFAAVIVGSLPTLMCTPLKEVHSAVLDDIEESIASKCKDAQSARLQEGEKWTGDDQKDCEEEQREKIGQQREAVDSESIKVASLWAVIASPENSPFLHVWAVSPLDEALGLEPANANGEFRHVCDGDEDAGGRGCAENSMWSNGWFAKLVPVRSFEDEVKKKLGEVAAGWFANAFGESTSAFVDRFLQRTGRRGTTAFLRGVFNRALGTGSGPRPGNGWWNRRLNAGEESEWLLRWKANDLERFPEYLH